MQWTLMGDSVTVILVPCICSDGFYLKFWAEQGTGFIILTCI